MSSSDDLYFHQVGYIEQSSTQYLCLSYSELGTLATPTQYILCQNSNRNTSKDSNYVYFYNLNDLITEMQGVSVNVGGKTTITPITPDIILTNAENSSITITLPSVMNVPVKLNLNGTGSCNFGIDPGCSLDKISLSSESSFFLSFPTSSTGPIVVDPSTTTTKIDIFHDDGATNYVQLVNSKTPSSQIQNFNLKNSNNVAYIYAGEKYTLTGNLDPSLINPIVFPIILNNNPYPSSNPPTIPNPTNNSVATSVDINANMQNFIYFLQNSTVYGRSSNNATGEVTCGIINGYNPLTAQATWLKGTFNNTDIAYFQKPLCESQTIVTTLKKSECLNTDSCGTGTNSCFGGGCAKGVCTQSLSDSTKFVCYDVDRDNIFGFIVDNATKIILLVIALTVLLVIVLIFIFMRNKSLESFGVSAMLILIVAAAIGFIFVNEWFYIFIGVAVLIFFIFIAEYMSTSNREKNEDIEL